MTTSNRLAWVDWCKTISILCIVLLHIQTIIPIKGIFSDLRADLRAPFTFIVPIFFAISGYFQKYVPTNQYKNYITKSAKALLIPYVGFYIINYFAWVIGTLLFSGEEITFYKIAVKPFLGLLIGNGTSIEGVSYIVSPPLWFLITLFTCRILALFFIKFNNTLLTLLFTFLLGLLGYILHKICENQYFSFITSLQSYPFFVLGFLLKKYVSLDKIKKQFYLPLALLAFVGMTTIACITEYGMDLNERAFGKYYLSFYFGGFMGIAFCILISLYLSKFNSKFNQFIAASTLIILGTQGIVIRVLILLFFIINPNLTTSESTLSTPVLYLVSIVMFILAVILLIPIIKFINAKAPWLAGRA